MPYITSPQTSLPSSRTPDSAGRTDAGVVDQVHPADTVDTRPTRTRFLGLSLTQVLGGSLAATAAAFLGAKLGLAGTLVGAATASVVSAIVSAAYAHSVDRTRDFLRATHVVTTTTTRSTETLGPVTAGGDRTAARTPSQTRTSTGAPPRTGTQPRTEPRTLRLDLRRVGLATLAVFAATAFAVTGYEFASGHSLDGRTGTTVSQVVSGRSAKAATTPSPKATTPAPTATATVTVTATQSPTSSTSSQPPPASSSTTVTPPPTATDSASPSAAATSPLP